MPESKGTVENVATAEFERTIATMGIVAPISAEDDTFYESKQRLRSHFPRAHMITLLPADAGWTEVLMVDDTGVYKTVVR
jgi:hypothetical protein